jgi:hypothetical protein
MPEADEKRSIWKETLTFLGWACIVAVTVMAIAAAPYAWNFKESRISKQSTDWSAFGGYMGGVLNPFVALVNLGVVVYIATQLNDIKESERIKKEDELREIDDRRKKQTLAFNLHQEWNSREMYLARTKAGQLVQSKPKLDFKEFEHSTNSKVVSLWIVLGFFQRLSALVNHSEVNDELAIELFVRLFAWWFVMCFEDNLPYDWDSWQPIHNLRDWFEGKAGGEYSGWYYKYQKEKDESLSPESSS